MQQTLNVMHHCVLLFVNVFIVYISTVNKYCEKQVKAGGCSWMVVDMSLKHEQIPEGDK